MRKAIRALASASFSRPRKLICALLGMMILGTWASAQVQTCPGGGAIPLAHRRPVRGCLVRARRVAARRARGAALSSAFQVTFRPPRVMASTHAWLNLGGGPLNPGHLTFIDPVTDAIASTTAVNVGDARKITRIPSRAAFAVPLFQPATMIADDTSGNTIATIGGGLSSGGNAWKPFAVSPDGSFMAFQTGGGFAPVTLTAVAISSGLVIGSAVLPTTEAPMWIDVIPGTQTAWAAGAYWIRFADFSTGFVTSSLAPGAIKARPIAAGNQLYFTTSLGLHVCDLTTHVISGPLATGGKVVAVGPGPGGPSVFLDVNLPTGPALVAVSPQTLALQIAPMPAPVNAILLTAGGTEWLVEVVPAATASGSLLVMNPSSLQFSTVLPSILADSTTILRSDTLRKAYALTGWTTAVAIPTDPAGTPGPSITLPFAADSLRSN
jgi:hypothetical protein